MPFPCDQNILIKDKPPEPWWVKIGDFGISKRVEDGIAAQSTLKGTLDFMAPELLGFIIPQAKPSSEDSQRWGQSVDMWALGGTAFQLLTGQACFKMPGLLGAYAEGKAPFPSGSLKEKNVGDQALDFISSIMAPLPVDRLDAQQALDHPWIKAQRPIPRPASVGSFR